MSEKPSQTFAETERQLRDQVEYHRDQMAASSHARAHLVADEVERRGSGAVPDVAADLGVTRQNVYRLINESKKHPR